MEKYQRETIGRVILHSAIITLPMRKITTLYRTCHKRSASSTSTSFVQVRRFFTFDLSSRDFFVELRAHSSSSASSGRVCFCFCWRLRFIARIDSGAWVGCFDFFGVCSFGERRVSRLIYQNRWPITRYLSHLTIYRTVTFCTCKNIGSSATKHPHHSELYVHTTRGEGIMTTVHHILRCVSIRCKQDVHKYTYAMCNIWKMAPFLRVESCAEQRPLAHV